MFSVWETRVGDFEAFVRATGYNATAGCWTLGKDGWKQRGESWKNPGFMQTDKHPVCGVSWDDAQAFCQWLTEKERREGKIKSGQSYRLPTDAEWSIAVGGGKYPWGEQWPPPSGAGNYGGEEAKDGRGPDDYEVIQSYRDGYERTSPAGSFTANKYGLYDMGGNVWEWCEDWYRKEMNSVELRKQYSVLDDDKGGTTYRVLRGASWVDNDPGGTRSSCRVGLYPAGRIGSRGFRCVLGQQNEVNCSQGKKDLSEIGDNSCENVSKRTKDILQITERAERGDIEAQYELGGIYGSGDGVPQDFQKAIKWFRKAALNGNLRSINEMGVYYALGNGVPKDVVESAKWFRKAAEQGHATSQFNLGNCYLNGDGVVKDSAEAVKWFRKAAGQGQVGAQTQLGWLYWTDNGVPKDAVEAAKWFRQAAEQGDRLAQNNLGILFLRGEGVPKNNVEAVKWFSEAAAQNDPWAQCNLADCYWDGNGIPKNTEAAIEWYTKSAEQGFAAAQFQLGIAYLTGEGVPKNEAVGKKWLRKSAEQGYEKAKACFR